MKRDVKRITEGSMMCAIIGVALLLNRELVGMLDIVLCWLFSLPIIIYTVRYGLKAALIPAVAMLLLSFMISMPASTFYLFAALIVGLGYGAANNAGASNRIKLFLVIVLTFISSFLTMVIFAGFFGYSPQEDIALLKMMFQVMNIDTPGNLVNIAIFISIFMVIIISVLQGITIHLLAYVLMKRLSLPVKPIKSLFEIRLPRFIGWICIVVWLLFLGTYVVKLESNVKLFMMGSYLVMSILTIGYGCLSMMRILMITNHRKWVFVLPFMAFIPYVQMVLMIIGIVDMINSKWFIRSEVR